MRLLPELRALGRPVAERVVDLSYLELQTRDDTMRGHALRRYWKGHYLRELCRPRPSTRCSRSRPSSAPACRPTAARSLTCPTTPPPSASAAPPSSTWAPLAGPSPAEDPLRIEQARAAAATLTPYASGVYVNVLTDEGSDGVRRAYPPEKLARLTALKGRYDPDNVFHAQPEHRPTRSMIARPGRGRLSKDASPREPGSRQAEPTHASTSACTPSGYSGTSISPSTGRHSTRIGPPSSNQAPSGGTTPSATVPP